MLIPKRFKKNGKRIIKPPLIFVNGLAEQEVSWTYNRIPISRYFDVRAPQLLLYGSDQLHQDIKAGLEIGVNYMALRLQQYLDEFVQSPPYNLVGSSAGCQAIIEYAVNHPDKIARLVLICPSGIGGEEKLPVIEGVKRSDLNAIIGSIFFNKKKFVTPLLLDHYKDKFKDRRWKLGFIRYIKGTVNHQVEHLLSKLQCPTLFICGEEDHIVEIENAYRAIKQIPLGKMLVVRRCGHAPQIEANRIVNKSIIRFCLNMPLKKGFKSKIFFRKNKFSSENPILFVSKRRVPMLPPKFTHFN